MVLELFSPRVRYDRGVGNVLALCIVLVVHGHVILVNIHARGFLTTRGRHLCLAFILKFADPLNNLNSVKSHLDSEVRLQVLIVYMVDNIPVNTDFLELLAVLRQFEHVGKPIRDVGRVPVLVTFEFFLHLYTPFKL